MECPECKTTLHARARYCGCGWRYSVAPPPAAIVDCSHETCNQPSIAKIQTRTGWAHLCNMHYDKHFRDEAHASLDKYGLARMADETQAEHVLRMRAFVKNGFKTIGKLPQTPKPTIDDKKAAIARLMDDWATDVGTQA